jgi:hypothetical protein
VPARAQGTWDNIKRLAMASFAMKATERNPDFVGARGAARGARVQCSLAAPA